MDKITSELKRIAKIISGLDPNDIGNDVNLFSLGLDSLMIAQFRKKINEKYGIDISINKFFLELTNLNKITQYIAEKIPQIPKAAAESFSLPDVDISTSMRNKELAGAVGDSAVVEKILAKQLEIIEIDREIMSQQLKTIRKISCSKTIGELKNVELKPLIDGEKKIERKPINIRSMKFERDELTPAQNEFVKSFIKRYNIKTQRSKRDAQEGRLRFSDWINSLNFRMSLKGLIYPVFSARSEGSKFWDIDGNEYFDIAMGYGVNYFGHGPGFIVEAIKKQLEEGFELGPQVGLTSEVSRLICELTGVERVAFGNTGTDAVMAALRIARTVTGRSKIVRFAGSYHGTFDGILAEADEYGTFPTSPGIPRGMIEDTIVLTYGSPESIDRIKEIGEELVEPVQSRRPGFQPREFLHELRHITTSIGAALIFDEVLTGFRICPGGAQEYFGVEADIVTYGKIIGGGMPIGVVAGKARFLDAVDGGVWNFGDDSYPDKQTTFFAGTFCKHPLSMAAARAALLHMKEKGPALQEKVNKRTANLAAVLNEFFEQEKVPIHVSYFGSIFRFESFGKYDLALLPIEMELFFYLLMEKGVYTWERRVCVLSTAHTDEDMTQIIEAVKESIEELRAGGFTFSREETGALPTGEETAVYPLSSAQRRLYFLCQLEGGEKPYHITGALKIHSNLDIEKCREAFTKLIERHESLRTGFEVRDNEIFQRVHDPKTIKFSLKTVKVSPEGMIEDEIKKFIRPFNLAEAPLMSACVLELSQKSYILVMDFHHIISDGLSLSIFLKEFTEIYGGKTLPLQKVHYRDYVAWEGNYLNSLEIKEHEKFWFEVFSGDLPQLNLPTDFPRPPIRTFEGKTLISEIEKERTERIRRLAKVNNVSLFMTLMACCNILLSKLSGQEDIIIGSPVAVREHENSDSVIGMFTNTLAFRNYPSGKKTFTDFLNEIRSNCLQAYIARYYPLDLLIDKLGLERNLSHNPLFSVVFVYENEIERLSSTENFSFTPYDFELTSSMFDFMLEVLEREDYLRLNLNYDTSLFSEEIIRRWENYFKRILDEICKNRNILLSDIDILSKFERHKILIEFNSTGSDYPEGKTLNELFEEQVDRTPDHIAINEADFYDRQEIGKKTLNYNELNERANQLARALRKKGVNPGTIVGITAELSQETVIGILGILKAGNAFLPIDPDYPALRKKFMIEDSQIKVLLTQRHLLHENKESLELFSSQVVIVIDDETLYTGNASNPKVYNSASSAAYVIYTSGSTGSPKGVLVNNQNIVNYIW